MPIRVKHKLHASFLKQNFVHPTIKAEQGANMRMVLCVKMMRKHDVEGRLVLTMMVILMTVDDKVVDDDDDDDDVEGRGLVLSWGQMFLSPA